MIWTKSKEG